MNAWTRFSRCECVLPHATDTCTHVRLRSMCTDLWAEVAKHAPSGCGAIFDANGVATLGGSYRRALLHLSVTHARTRARTHAHTHTHARYPTLGPWCATER